MRRLVLLLTLFAVACGGDSQGPPDGSSTCRDQVYADLNRLVSSMDDLLYRADVAQMLLLKGATNRFRTTVSGHEGEYSRQEVFDALTAAVEFEAVADSMRSLLSEIGEAADTLDAALAWKPPFDRFREAAESTLARGDSLSALFRERARSIAETIAPLDTLGLTVALACEARGIAPSFATFADFVQEADTRSWSRLLPSFLSCGQGLWTEGWAPFIRQAVGVFAESGPPLVGPITLHLKGEIESTEAGWGPLKPWAEGTGSVRVDPETPGEEGAGIAILVPQDDPLLGCTYRALFAGSSTTIPGVPAGSYRLLLFRSGARPYASDPFQVPGAGTAALTPHPAPFESEGCSLSGGDVAAWVIDPSNIEHLSNDYDLSCVTEVWTGTVLYADTVGVPGFRIRSEGSFRAVVDCGNRSFSGTGAGTLTATPIRPDGCVTGALAPERFTFRMEGSRASTSIQIRTEVDSAAFSLSIECPEDSTRVVDITGSVFKGRSWTVPTGTGPEASIVLPPGSSPLGPRHWRMDLRRVF